MKGSRRNWLGIRRWIDRPGWRTANARAILSGKTALVTGASSGIGRTVSLQLAKAGARVLLVARNQERLDEVAKAIESLGGECRCFSADLSDPKICTALISTVLSREGPIDLLINNAGLSIRRPISDSYHRLGDYERTIQLNYLAAVSLTLGFLPDMQTTDSGHVINISSIGVRTGAPYFSAYVASKAALDHFARTLALELGRRKTAVTTINFGLVRTPMIEPSQVYDRFPSISADQAANRVIDAVIGRPLRVSSLLGTLLEMTYALSPRLVNAVFILFHDRAHRIATRRRSDDFP
ncbi:MAG: short-subunit dehydrogenase [Bacteroidia bacterium]|jgi:short-subunit dehydrogenase